MKEQHIRYLGIILLSFLLPFVVTDATKYTYWEGVVISFVHCLVLWNGCVWIMLATRRWYPDFQDTKKRLVYLILLGLSFIIIASISIDTFLYSVGIFKELCFSREAFLKTFRTPLSVSLIISAIYESAYLFQQWQNTILEAEKLKSQHIRSQLEVLKNQVSPHFLFNSLNTLITIIPENQDLAVEFTQKLSKVYRYILQNRDKELVSLNTELQFIHSYVFLLKIRFGDNLIVNYNIKENYLDHYVAPLTLQMLVENAIKHNIVSTARPLTIDIYIDNGKSIIVKNNLQVKNSVINSTKVGLENIVKRYKYLSNQAVDIITTTSNFMVALPLIQLNEPYPSI